MKIIPPEIVSKKHAMLERRESAGMLAMSSLSSSI